MQEEKQKQVEEIRKRAKWKAREFSDVFTSDSGKRVLLEIETQFGGFIVTENPHTTIINAAQQDVVTWIKELIERGKGYDLER